MRPEQLRAIALDGRSDIYSLLDAFLYESDRYPPVCLKVGFATRFKVHRTLSHPRSKKNCRVGEMIPLVGARSGIPRPYPRDGRKGVMRSGSRCR